MGDIFSKIVLVLRSDLSEVPGQIFSLIGLILKKLCRGLTKERMSFDAFKRSLPQDLWDVADQLYKERYGLDGLVAIGRGPQEIMENTQKTPCTKREGYSLTNLVLGITALILLLALLFPPFYVSLPNGLIFNQGFHFLFDPPALGTIVAMVNIPMLIIELAVIVVIGLAVLLIARNLESAGIR